MRKFMLFITVLSVFFLACSCSSIRFPQNRPVDVPDDLFGIVHAGHRVAPEEFGLLDEMNVKWTLRTFNWSSIERKQGEFDFSGYDTYVDATKKAGIKIIAVLAYETPWLFPDGEVKRYVSKENIPHFLRYVEEMVKHYQGKIDVWNIWNEPNYKRFWTGSDKEFYELSRLAAQKIRETDPNACIIGGAFIRAPKRMIKRMNKAGGMKDLDGLSFHPYALNAAGSMGVHDRFVKILSKINFTGTVWITEIGHPTGGRYPHKVSLERLPEQVVKDMTGVAVRGVNAMLWYQLFDHYNREDVPPKELKDSENFFGLVYPDYSRKDGANAFQLCAGFLQGSRYVPNYLQRERIPSSIVSVCFLKGASGDNTLVLWNKRKRPRKVNLHLDTPATLYDITTGKGQPLSAITALAIGKQPLIITWRGTDVPRLSKNK